MLIANVSPVEVVELLVNPTNVAEITQNVFLILKVSEKIYSLIKYKNELANGQRGCCAGKTYNTNSLECCSTGEVKAIGMCAGGY